MQQSIPTLIPRPTQESDAGMNERAAERTSTRLPKVGSDQPKDASSDTSESGKPGKAGKPGKPDKQGKAEKPASTSAAKTGDKPGGKGGKGGGTTSYGLSAAARASLSERVQSRFARAHDEHRANAQPGSTSAATKAAGDRKPPRRARLRLTRIDPWSVMKTAFLLSIAFGIVTVVSVLMVWSVLGAAGVWESINATVADVVGSQEAAGFDVENYLGTSRVLGFTMLVAVVDVVLLTAIATLGAFLYNMAAALLGGVEMTLAEDN